MRKLLFTLVAGSFLMSSCSSQESTQDTPSEVAATSTPAYLETDSALVLGLEEVNANEAVSLSEAITDINGKTSDTLKVTVYGLVGNSCQSKGCWMAVKDEEGNSLHVDFENYQFFVPTEDLNGRKVVMKGYIYNEVTTVEQLKEQAESDGFSKEDIAAITNEEVNPSFTATGVLLAKN